MLLHCEHGVRANLLPHFSHVMIVDICQSPHIRDKRNGAGRMFQQRWKSDLCLDLETNSESESESMVHVGLCINN
jgi:hypothetical protein